MQGETKSFGVNVCCCGEREVVATLVRNDVETTHTFEDGLIKLQSMFRNRYSCGADPGEGWDLRRVIPLPPHPVGRDLWCLPSQGKRMHRAGTK